jgi:hypothetical protein
MLWTWVLRGRFGYCGYAPTVSQYENALGPGTMPNSSPDRGYARCNDCMNPESTMEKARRLLE